jgi:hypothetical protein
MSALDGRFDEEGRVAIGQQDPKTLILMEAVIAELSQKEIRSF